GEPYIFCRRLITSELWMCTARWRRLMNNPADEISQREKRRILIEERRMRTYQGHALDADLDLGGRFAKVHTTTVTGSSPISYPPHPTHSPWHSNPCPPEPPLGYSVEEMEPVGERTASATSSPVTARAQAGDDVRRVRRRGIIPIR